MSIKNFIFTFKYDSFIYVVMTVRGLGYNVARVNSARKTVELSPSHTHTKYVNVLQMKVLYSM